MSSQKRKDSSRANGAKSHGPVTPEGRARSRAARLSHGLTSDQITLAYESEEQFAALREEYFADYQPQTRSRFDLVYQLVITRWHLNRVIALQTALMDNEMIRQQPEIRAVFEVCNNETKAALAYQHLIDDGGALESFNRHETRLSAEFRRTMKLLDAQLANQKPPQSDEDGYTAEAPPSTIDHPPSTNPDAPPKNQKFHHEPSPADSQSNEEDPAGEAPPIPSPGSTGHKPPAPYPSSPSPMRRFRAASSPVAATIIGLAPRSGLKRQQLPGLVSSKHLCHDSRFGEGHATALSWTTALISGRQATWQ